MRKLFKILGGAGLLSLLSTPALAAPVIIIGAVIGASVGAAAVATGLITATFLTAALVGAAVGAGAAFLLGDGLMGMFDVPEFAQNNVQQAQNENTGILVDKLGTLEHIPVIYGNRKVSGARVFVSTSGENNKYLYLALVLCEGEIEAIDEIFFDDVISTDARFSGRFEFEKFLGSDSQTASSLLQEAPGWSSNHRLQGLAYIAFRFEWPKIETNEEAEQNPWRGIPRIKAMVRGRKVADATSAGGTTYANETVRYSTNPADHLLDYLRNPRFGKGLGNSRINFTSFSTLATKCNQTVTYHNSGTTGPMLTSNCVIDTSKNIMDNVKTFLTNTRCGMPYVQGQFKVKMLDTGNGTDSQNTSPDIAFAITENHLSGGLVVEGTNSRNHYNQVTVTHPSPGHDWEMTEVTYPVPDSQEDADLLAADNGKRLSHQIALQHIIEPALAGDLAHIILTRSRNKKTITFETTAELHEVEVGDVVTITYAPLGFSAAKYRIQSMKIQADYTLSFTAVEHEPTEYVFKAANNVSIPPKVMVLTDSRATNNYVVTNNSTFAPYVGTRSVTRPNARSGGDPSNLSVTYNFNVWESGTSNKDHVTLSWNNPSDVYNYDIAIIYRRNDFSADPGFPLQKMAEVPVAGTSTQSADIKLTANVAFPYTLGLKLMNTNPGFSSKMITTTYTASGVGKLYSHSGVVVDGVLVEN